MQKILLLVLTAFLAFPAHAREWIDIPGPKYRGKDLSLQALLMKPEGEGPFPVVVILHGCQGMQEQSDVRWAKRFNEWGYTALMLDSFRARGYLESCNLNVTQGDRARDAHAAKRWLLAQPFVRKDAVALFGISHGGFGALSAVNSANYPNDKAFAAVLALYPYCAGAINVLGSPLRIIIGDADELAPRQRCEELVIRHKEGNDYQVSVYPGATHFFDIAEIVSLTLRMPNRDTSIGAAEFMNVEMKHDAALTERAVKEIRTFFGENM